MSCGDSTNVGRCFSIPFVKWQKEIYFKMRVLEIVDKP
jgi:hypothetical protein